MKCVQRAVASEVAGLVAFETGNRRGRGLIDRPTGRYPGKRLRGRLPARIRPSSTCLVPLLADQLHRAPCDGHLPHQIKNLLRLVVPSPSLLELILLELMVDLDLEVGGLQPSRQRFTNGGRGICPKHVTENAFSTWVLKVLFKGIRSTAGGSDPMVTRRHTPAGAIDGSMESSAQHSASFASVSRKSSA